MTSELQADPALDAPWAPVRSITCRPPLLGGAVLERPELVARLRAATPGSLVAVTAPAGYGKTTTAALWAKADPRPFAWVAIDPLDDDPAHLVSHVATALAEQGLIDGEDVRFLSGPGRAALGELIPMLGELLVGMDPFVLVVDDVHLLGDAAATDVLVALVDALPPSALVALLSRTPPLRGTARRRLRDEVLELRPSDLALDIDEARAAFAALGVELSQGALVRLVERCEGWPGGLHLAALSIRDRGEVEASISGRNRLVADYLVEEVLVGLPNELVGFLEEASTVSPMTADLLDEILGRDNAGRRLAALEADGCLFLVALDDEGERFRFHHLFQELLESRFRRRDPTRWRAVHARAGEVLLARGDVDGAIHHAVVAGDAARAAALVQRDAVALATSGRATVLGRRLALLDDLEVTEDGNAALARAWWSAAAGDVHAVREALAVARRLDHRIAPGDGSATPATAAALMAGIIGDGGLTGVVESTTVVIDADPRWRATALTVRATALIQLGRHEEAHRDLRHAIEDLPAMPAFEAVALELLAWLLVRDGDTAAAGAAADAGHALAHRHDLRAVVPAVPAWSCDALVAARVGDRARAIQDATIADAALARLGREAPRTLVFNHQVLAEVHHLLGEGAEARRHLNEAMRVHRGHPLSPWFEAEGARLADLLGRGPAGTSLAITPLTVAERRVLPHLATHLSLPQIANELCVSRNTVKTHCVSLYRKLGVTSRAEAVAEARRLGLIDA